MMVKDWEPPADPRRPLRILGRVAVVLLVAVAVAAVTPAARDLLWPEPVVTRSVPTPNTMSSPAPVTTPPRLEAPRPATDEPVAPRAERRDSVRVLPPSSIARPRTTPSPTAPAAATRPAPTAEAADAGSATLFVNASPWGQVFVDGTLIGNTPRANIALSVGSHTIRVSRSGFATWERTIRVAAGETVRFTDIVLTPDRP